jgi:hypothetical protein
MAPSKVQVVLDQWYEASFHLSDKDAESVMRGTIPMEAAEAVKALANGADSYILGLYKGVYNYAGTSGTTPFATNLNSFKQARTLLNKALASPQDRRVVLNPDAEGNALLNPIFLQADQRGDQGGVISGQIGHKLGSDWFMNQNVPTHTPGTWKFTGAGAAMEVKTSAAVGATTLIIFPASTTNTAGGTILIGDVFSIAGHAQPYVVTANASAGVSVGQSISLSIQPPLSQAAPAGTQVTLPSLVANVATPHAVNLHFHRDAFAFASRPLSSSTMAGGGALFSSITDPISGVTLRLEVSRQYKQWTYSYDVLYGAKLVRPQLAARILG